MARRLRVLLADDHPVFREGLRAIVGRVPGYEVAAEAGSRAEALRLAREVRPDLAILDVSLPDGSGIELVRQLRALLPELRVVMLSMHTKIDVIAESFRAGASAYVVKESTADRLAEALEAAAGGGQYLDSAVAPKVVRKLLEHQGRRIAASESPYDTLSRREQQVMRLLAEGHSAAAIAERLFISRKTVDNHRANIMAKLGLTSLVELVRYAVRLGLVDLEADEV